MVADLAFVLIGFFACRASFIGNGTILGPFQTALLRRIDCICMIDYEFLYFVLSYVLVIPLYLCLLITF